jgi:hypothetical protein
MDEKTAIVIDTNFIIEHKSDLQNAHQKLSKHYDIFVSDVSIQERLSQKYLELRTKYDKIEKFKVEYIDLANIEIKHSFEEEFKIEKDYTVNAYQKLFGNNIIPFVPNIDTLKIIMDRVFKKIPPFINAEKASDRGFKDAMLWLSLLDFFKNYDGNKVVFLTNDNGFRNNINYLLNEFNKSTGRTIEIQENNYYNTLIEKNEEPTAAVTLLETDILKERINEPLPDVSALREKIQKVISSLCEEEYSRSYWDEPEWQDTFTLQERLEPEDMKNIFDNLREILRTNILETALPANKAFVTNKRIKNCWNISISTLQNALYLYEEIYSKYQEYLPQFYSATANIFNRNYQEFAIPPPPKDSNNELPF